MNASDRSMLGGNPDLEYPTLLARVYGSAFPDSDEVAAEVSLRLYAAYDAYFQAVGRLLGSKGSVRTLARYRVLRCLYFAETDRKTQAEIVNELGVTSANVTRLVDGLETSGLVARGPHPTDRRITYVELTREGRAAAAELVAAMAGFMAGMCSGLSETEKEEFATFLMKLQRNAAEYEAPASPLQAGPARRRAD